MDITDKLINKLVGRHGLVFLVVFASISTLLIAWLETLAKTYIKQYISNIPGILQGILILVLWIFFIKMCQWIWERIIFYYKLLRQIFRGSRIYSVPQISDWVFQGSLKMAGNSLELTASNSGCLIRDYLYKNFILTCNMKISNGGRGSLIFRAKDLENYLMIQFELADTPDGTIVQDIIPHIRHSGNFETFKIYHPVYPNEKYFPIAVRYSSKDGFLINLKVKDNIVALTLGDEGQEFYWNIPTHTEQNILNGNPMQIIEPLNKLESLTGRTDPLDGIFVPKIWFGNSYGRIGFRAWGLEKIIINNLKIEPI
jgi:hypothetical protein